MYKIYIKKNTTSMSLLRKVLKEYGISDEIVYNAYGKPYLKNNELYFNISNKDNITVLVIASCEVGVDIEKITMHKRIIDRICNEEEKESIKTPEDFTLMWVKKESYVKYLGVGLNYDLQKVDTLNKQYIIKKIDDYYIAIYGEDLI